MAVSFNGQTDKTIFVRSMLNQTDFRKDKVNVLLICINGELHHWANAMRSATE